jgi:hypothetical protein
MCCSTLEFHVLQGRSQGLFQGLKRGYWMSINEKVLLNTTLHQHR